MFPVAAYLIDNRTSFFRLEYLLQLLMAIINKTHN